MSKTQFRSNRAYVAEFLAEALTQNRLALFLGSGVSRDLYSVKRKKCGLPSWEQLVRGLYQSRRMKIPTGTNYIQQVEDFRNRFLSRGNSTTDEFYALVQKLLYLNLAFDFSVINRHPTLAAIGALVAHSRRGSVKQLFTLNFDDIVERFLRYQGVLATPVIEEKFWSRSADILVHHPHGFLASPGSPFEQRSSFLVFDQESYARQNPDDRWNQSMEVAMQSHICLFIGLGRDDFHLKQLVARWAKHAFKVDHDGYWGVVLRAGPSEAEVREWKRYHLHVETLANYHSDLPSFLFQICQRAAKHTEMRSLISPLRSFKGR